MEVELNKPLNKDVIFLVHTFLTGAQRMSIVRDFGIPENTGRSALNGNRSISDQTYDMVLKVIEEAKSVRNKGLRKTKKIA